MHWTYGGIDVLSRFAGELDTDHDSTPFWEGLSKGEIRAQRCDHCATYRFPPGPFCLNCGSAELRYVALTSTPRLFSWIIVTRSTHPSMPAPYVVAIVEYDEGVRIPGALQVDPDVHELRINMPVSATVVQGERPFVTFHISETTQERELGVANLKGEESTWPVA